MSTAYRSSANVVHATAGTSIAVSKPAATVNGDVLVAYIAVTGATAITAPAGWTLITTVTASTSVRLAAYYKVASGEGASWTWTLGASVRNWGWVGAYTGVDPVNPIFAQPFGLGTDDTLDAARTLQLFSDLAGYGQGTSAAATVRTATGTATTWTTTSTERADLSTNGGSGTDIAGVVGDMVNVNEYGVFYDATLTASQDQTAGVAIAVTLRPLFVPYGGGPLDVRFEAAFGADPDDVSTWSWTDITEYVLIPDSGPAVTITAGRPNNTGTADASTVGFTLLNLNGEFTFPTGAYTADMVLYTPFRIRVAGIGAGTYHRATAFLQSARPRWDSSLNFAVVDVTCRGRLWRLNQDDQPLHSAAYRSAQALTGGSSAVGVVPVAHWSLEDGSSATSAAAAVPGAAAAYCANVDFAADSSSFVGAATAVRFGPTSTIVAAVPTHTATGTWTAIWGLLVPTEPVTGSITLMAITSSAGVVWQINAFSGGLEVRCLGADGSVRLSETMAVAASVFYGHPHTCVLQVVANGSASDYDFTLSNLGGRIGSAPLAPVAAVTQLAAPAQEGLDGAVYSNWAYYTDTALISTIAPTIWYNALILAHAGEWPWARAQRLTDEERVPFIAEHSTNQDLTMGPQRVDTLANLLAECSAVEGNLFHDAGTFVGSTGLLSFPARESRDNRAPDITLSMRPGSGQIAPGWSPVLDDQDYINDAEVSRPNGSSAVHVTDEVAVAKGRRSRPIQVNTFDDRFLADIGGWALHLSSQRGYRYTSATINLRNANTRSLVEAWLACGLDAAKVLMTDPPSQFNQDDIETFIESYTEQLGKTCWIVSANLSPGHLNRVGVLSANSGDTDPYVGHLDWDSCVIHQATVTTTATSFTVDPTPLLTTNSDDYPYFTMIGAEKVRFDSATGASNPQTVNVTRSINGIVQAHAALDVVELHNDSAIWLGR